MAVLGAFMFHKHILFSRSLKSELWVKGLIKRERIINSELKHPSILSQLTNFGLFQTERVYRRQFEFNENWRKISKGVENTLGKGEISRYGQFLLFPLWFQNTLTEDM